MKPATVLIVDDSRIYRAAIESALSGQDGVAVIGSVFSGQKALDFMQGHFPDVVTLDVEMPGMNGLETLQAIQKLNHAQPPGGEAGVIMVSAFTQRGADVTMQALQAGALDFVTKPAGANAEENIEHLRRALVPRIRMYLAKRNRADRNAPAGLASPAPAAERPRPSAPAPRRPLQAVLVGASTGGPKALATLLPELIAATHAPILVVQHMPAPFTSSFAQYLSRHLGGCVTEAEDGQVLMPRSVYIAPGGRHLTLRRNSCGQLVAGLADAPPECGCRPAVDTLFRSAAAVVGRETVAIVLTGMGNDGTAGLASLRRAGAYVVVQDEASSVVWGMPGSAVAAGLVDAICPLADIAAAVAAVAEPKRTP